MKTEPTAEHLRQAFEYLRSTALRGPPWPATLDQLPPECARMVAVRAVARGIARRQVMADAMASLPPRTTTPPPPRQRPLPPAPRHDAKRAAANDRDEDSDAD